MLIIYPILNALEARRAWEMSLLVKISIANDDDVVRLNVVFYLQDIDIGIRPRITTHGVQMKGTAPKHRLQ
jgi:hypothetical protein